MVSQRDILGSGFAVPLALNPRGGIREARYEEKVRQSMRVILGAQRGERLMRPNFGANLKSLVFAPNNAATANLARFYVEEALRTWEPRILVDEVHVQNDNAGGQLLIDIRYRIKATNEPQNLVYPFYLQQL
jgi:phage baseplate assembly protein W